MTEKIMDNTKNDNGLGLENAKPKMDANRKTALIVGILFIIASAASVMSLFFFNSIYDSDYLTTVAANENNVLIGVLLMLAATASIVAIPIVLYPVLKKHNETLALGYTGARIFEGLFFVLNIVTLLSILSLSKEYVSAGTESAEFFRISGSLLLKNFEWNGHLLDFPFVLSTLILNYALYKSNLIPRRLSAWGFVGGIIWISGVVIGMFSTAYVTVLAAPIGLQEMVLAGWLIVKGFNSTKADSMTSEMGTN